MYVIRNNHGNYLKRYAPTQYNDMPVEFTGSLTDAARFENTTEALHLVQEGAGFFNGPFGAGLTLLRLTVTPGSTTRREVPLGTPNSKVAIKGVSSGSLFKESEYDDSLIATGSIRFAELYDAVEDALCAIQYESIQDYAVSTYTLVGILEETTGETLSVEEVK